MQGGEAHEGVPAAPGQPPQPTDQSHLPFGISAGGGWLRASHQGPGATGNGLNQLGDCRGRFFEDYTSLPICNVGHQANTNYGGGLVSFVNLIFHLK